MTVPSNTPETALQREQRLYRELSSRLLDTLLNRVFDLRPEKAVQRASYIFVLFFVTGLALSIYYFLPDWAQLFNNLLGQGGDLNTAMLSFTSLVTKIIREPRILQYLPVFLAPYFIALQSAAIYLADIFELEDVSIARNFISGVALRGSDQTIRIKNGEVVEEDKEKPTFLIGGPGKVLVELDSVALFERADGTPHVIGPTGKEPGGKATLEGFERFRQALDIRNQYVELRDQSSILSRSLDGIPIKATDVRLLFSIFRGENTEPSAEIPYPFSKVAVEQIVYKATSKVTPERLYPSTFEFSWTPKMIGLIRGKLSGFMSQHNPTEYLASTGMPEFEKAKLREEKIFEQMQQLSQSSDDSSGRKDVKPPPNFQPRYKVKNLFAQFADDFTNQSRNSGVELHWIGVGTWASPVVVVPEKHLNAWLLTQENLKNDSPVAMNRVEQDEVVEKTKELIEKVPLMAFEEILNVTRQTKKPGKQASRKKDQRQMDNDDDYIVSDDDRDQHLVEMLSILHDMQEEKPQEIEPKDTDHAHDVQALLLEYRRLFVETADFIKAKKEPVPQNILDAIRHIDNQIGHWAGSS